MCLSSEDYNQDVDFSSKVLSTRLVKNPRKPWRCDICGKTFPAGTPKHEQYVVYDGDFCTVRWCVVNGEKHAI